MIKSDVYINTQIKTKRKDIERSVKDKSYVTYLIYTNNIAGWNNAVPKKLSIIIAFKEVAGITFKIKEKRKKKKKKKKKTYTSKKRFFSCYYSLFF